jgi:hypothetical protein
MSYVGSELGDIVYMIEFPLWAFDPLLLEGVGDWLVRGEDDEVARFQHVAEMLYGFVHGQQLAVVRAVFLLGRVEFLEKKKRGTARRSQLVAEVCQPWRTSRRL